MPTIDTHTATGDALDYAVAIAMGYRLAPDSEALGYCSWTTTDNVTMRHPFRPSSDANDAMRAIEGRVYALEQEYPDGWVATDNERRYQRGLTLMVAAARCVAYAEFGRTFDVPDWVLTTPAD